MELVVVVLIEGGESEAVVERFRRRRCPALSREVGVECQVEGGGAAAEGVFMSQLAVGAVEARGVDGLHGVVVGHRGIEFPIGVEGGDLPSAAEAYGCSSAAEEVRLVGGAVGAYTAGGAPQSHGQFTETDAVVENESLAECRLVVADDEGVQGAYVAQHRMTTVAVPERSGACEHLFAGVGFYAQTYIEVTPLLPVVAQAVGDASPPRPSGTRIKRNVCARDEVVSGVSPPGGVVGVGVGRLCRQGNIYQQP